jgi:hypothetical protein
LIRIKSEAEQMEQTYGRLVPPASRRGLDEVVIAETELAHL